MSGRWEHGHSRGWHSGKPSPTFVSWLAMRQRCYYKRGAKYKRYGARGIRVCKQWRWSFAAFLRDMGERPPGKTLDRIDPRGGYTPENCRWASLREQNENRDRTGLAWKARRTHCPHGHAFTDDNTRRRKDGSRRCLACQRTQAKARRAKRAA